MNAVASTDPVDRRSEPAVAVAHVASCAQDGAQLPPINQRVLDDLMKEVGDVDGRLRNDLIASYLADGEDQVVRLVSAAAVTDGPAVAALAHTLRSTSALLGASVLAGLLQEAEQMARNSPAHLAPVATQIRVEYARVAVALAKLTSSAAPLDRSGDPLEIRTQPEAVTLEQVESMRTSRVGLG